MVAGLVIRQGLGAESLAYSIMIVLLPLCCVYYPVWALPAWLHPVAWSLTPTYVFEGMRAVLIDGVFRADLMIECIVLNLVYFGLGFTTFMLLLHSARHEGGLLSAQEANDCRLFLRARFARPPRSRRSAADQHDEFASIHLSFARSLRPHRAVNTHSTSGEVWSRFEHDDLNSSCSCLIGIDYSPRFVRLKRARLSCEISWTLRSDQLRGAQSIRWRRFV